MQTFQMVVSKDGLCATPLHSLMAAGMSECLHMERRCLYCERLNRIQKDGEFVTSFQKYFVVCMQMFWLFLVCACVDSLTAYTVFPCTSYITCNKRVMTPNKERFLKLMNVPIGLFDEYFLQCLVTSLLELLGCLSNGLVDCAMSLQFCWYFRCVASVFRGSAQTKGVCLQPKRSLAVMGCEVARILQLTEKALFAVSYLVQRKVRQSLMKWELWAGRVSGWMNRCMDRCSIERMKGWIHDEWVVGCLAE